MLLNEIVLHFRKYNKNKPELTGSELLLSCDKALELLKVCHENDFAILGIEGFKIDEQNNIEPQVDIIADFSSLLENNWNEYKAQAYQEAQQFLLQFSKNPLILFSLEFLSEEEYLQEILP